MKKIEHLHYQPGEASWASEKCGGGPHTSGDNETYHPAILTVEQMYRVGSVVLPYAGTETSLEELPKRPSVAVLYTFRGNIWA